MRPADADHTPAYDVATLETCDDEPIQVPGAIQPHGALLAVDADERVVVASANAEAMLGRDVGAVRGSLLADVIGQVAVDAVRQAVAESAVGVSRRVHVACAGELGRGPADLTAYASGDRVVVELEPAGSESQSVSYRATRAALARLTQSRTVGELCEQLASEVRELTGFDRVMVYRFDEHWNGEVIAEERRADLEPFLGLHYPASDIPEQARRLYTINWTRLIADVDYTPVPLDPVRDPGTGRPLDLSHSALRSVSPIHLQYLRNMGVRASMSVSMLADDDLWGLVACHHYSGPHHVSSDARGAAEFLGQMVSQLILDRQYSDQRAAELLAEHEISALLARLATESGPVLSALVQDPATAAMFDAGGVALSDGETLHTAGAVPSEEDLRRIAAAIRPEDGTAAAVDRLAAVEPAFADIADRAAGAVVIGSRDDWWMAWVRPAHPHVVEWGGDPREALSADGAKASLTPRASFERWAEQVRDRSAPWQDWARPVAERLLGRVSREIARRSREHTAVAESLQRALVPDETPRVAGFDVLARYRPAADMQLGGDWWDVFDLPDGRVALTVGDVSGHGVEAATTMAQLRTGLRAYALDGHGPAAVLDRLDRFASELLPGRTATVVMAALDPRTGAIEVANAGHVPPLVLGPDGEVAETTSGRPLLGAGVGRASTDRLELAEGAVLVVYTDGLIERRGLPLDESLDALRAVQPPGPAAALEEWVEHLLSVVPGASDDDLTVVSVRRTGLEPDPGERDA